MSDEILAQAKQSLHRFVEIECLNGKVYRGILRKVEGDTIYLEEFNHVDPSDLGG